MKKVGKDALEVIFFRGRENEGSLIESLGVAQYSYEFLREKVDIWF